jgi:RNA polymerase sigma factor (sigma-70 family)
MTTPRRPSAPAPPVSSLAAVERRSHAGSLPEDLLSRARAGDREAENGLFEKLHARTLALAKRKVWDEEAARDIAQETLRTAFEKYREADLSRGLFPWVFTILHNKVGNYLKRRRVAQRHDAGELDALAWETIGAGADHAIEEFELSDSIEKALVKATPECRKVFRLLLAGADRRRIAQSFGAEPGGSSVAREGTEMTAENEPRTGHDPWRERLAYYELGRVSDDERAALERHVLECDACFAELERGSLVTLAARAGCDRLVGAIDAAERERGGSGARLARWLRSVLNPRIAAPAFGALAVLLLVMLRSGPERDDLRALASFPHEGSAAGGVRAPGVSGAVDELLQAGRGYLDTGRYEQARQAFRAAAARDPEHAEATYLAGLGSALAGDLDAAIGELAAAERLASGELAAKIHWSLANAYLKAGRRDEAIAALESLARADTSSGGVYPAAARTLLERLRPR